MLLKVGLVKTKYQNFETKQVRRFGHVPLGGDQEDKLEGSLSVVWEILDITPHSLEVVCMDHKIWASLHRMLPHNPTTDKAIENGWIKK